MILTRTRDREKSEEMGWLICEINSWSYVYLQICIRINVFVHVYVFAFVFVHVCVCICVFVCLYVCVYACLSKGVSYQRMRKHLRNGSSHSK